MTVVYVAAPYTKGDVGTNMHNAVEVAHALIQLGYCPYVPVLNHFVHIAHPHPYATWMALDLEMLPRCDVLLRLPGESPGADREVAAAQAGGMPVVYSVRELVMYDESAHVDK